MLLVLLAGLLVYAWMQFPVRDWIDAFRVWIQSTGTVGILAFVGVYLLATIVLGPLTALMLAAGLAYGFWGFPLVVGCTTLGSALAFLLGRYCIHDRVNRYIEKDRRLMALNKAVSEEGWKVVALLRLSPVIPYGLQNYLFSVTHIRFLPYLVATLAGILPTSALFVYIGSLGSNIGRMGRLHWFLAGAGLISTVVVVTLVSRRALRELSKHTPVN